MSERPTNDDPMSDESDFRRDSGVCSTFPRTPRSFCLPPSSEAYGQYFSAKAEQKGVELSELLTDVLKRDIEINEALK